MILPVLATLFLATFDGGRALAVYMKVRAATYALDAITNQYSTIQSTDMTTIVGATSTVLAPYSSSPRIVTISQITDQQQGQAPRSAGAIRRMARARAQGSSITLPSNGARYQQHLSDLGRGELHLYAAVRFFHRRRARPFPTICTLLRASAIASIIRRRASQAASQVSRGGCFRLGRIRRQAATPSGAA